MMYKHSKLGKLFYNISIKSSEFLYKHKIIYYLLSLTWGGVMTLIGLFVSLCLLITGHKPKRYEHIWYFEIGSLWGGVSLGLCVIRDKESEYDIIYHEFGHTFQNALFGPFAIILAFIPSMFRYWIFTIREMKHKSNPDYDSIWFEHSATDIGEELKNK